MMKIEDLMVLMKKSREEVEAMFKENNTIELNLKESAPKSLKEEGEIKLM